MQSKASLILKRLTNYRRFSTTWGFVQAWQDVVNFGICSLISLYLTKATNCRVTSTVRKVQVTLILSDRKIPVVFFCLKPTTVLKQVGITFHAV